MRTFIQCDAHPSKGGPHISRGVFVARYFNLDANVVACTHRSKRGRVCGELQLELDEGSDRG